MPRLSVIMPVLDGEQYLPDTLASLSRYLPKDAEVRVMDDGSSDSTPRLLADIANKDSRFVIHRHESPQGVHNSLNELAALGDSDFIARMDADDVVLPTRWVATRAAMGHADFVFTTVLFIDETGKVKGADQPGHFSAAATPYHLAYGSMLVHPTVTMRRSVFDDLGGYADTRAEDYEMWMRAAVAGHRIVRVAIPGLKYRRHSNQVTSKRPWLEEGQESPLYPAYGALLDKLLGHRPEGWERVFRSALGPSPMDKVERQHAHSLYDELAGAASRHLNPHDALLVRWRARRETARVDARTTSLT